jgi:protein Mpv17
MLSRAWTAYSRLLHSNPLATKCVTVSTLCIVGDAVSQVVAEPKLLRLAAPYDVARTARIAVFGFAISGPVNHVWYNVLERAVPGVGVKALLAKTAADQLLFAPVILTLFFGSQVLLANKGVDEATAVVRRSLWPSLQMNWMFWPAAQMVNFKFVPPAQRVGFVSLCLVFWNGVLSYWFNQQAKKQQQQQQIEAK